MAHKSELDIAQAVYDNTDILLDTAAWIRAFYIALKLTGFDNKAASEITASWVSGRMGKED